MSILKEIETIKDKAEKERAAAERRNLAYAKRAEKAVKDTVSKVKASLKELQSSGLVIKWKDSTSCTISNKGCNPFAWISVDYHTYTVDQDDEGHYSSHENVFIHLKHSDSWNTTKSSKHSDVASLEKELARLLVNVV